MCWCSWDDLQPVQWRSNDASETYGAALGFEQAAIITRKNLLKDAANIAFLASEMPLARVSFL